MNRQPHHTVRRALSTSIAAASIAACAHGQVEVTVDARANCGNASAPGTVLNLDPGEWLVTPLDGALNIWGYENACDSNGNNCDAGWIWFFTVLIGTDPDFTLPPKCCASVNRWSTSAAALAHARASIFTVPGDVPLDVKFFLDDIPCGDNEGRVSFLVSPHCRADFNLDGFVDFFDFNDFVTCFDGSACPAERDADFNADGFVDFFDFNDFVDAFESGC